MPVALIALVFLFPAAPAPTVSDMNWSVLVLGAVLGGSLGLQGARPAEELSATEGDAVKATINLVPLQNFFSRGIRAVPLCLRCR